MNNPRHKAMIFLFTALAIAILCGCSRQQPPNVLFITLDALRADHMSIYGYPRETSPHLDKFFEKGTVYEYAYCTETNTSPSVASFLSGMLPQDIGVRLVFQKFPEDLKLMPDYLSAEGYQTAGIVSNMVLISEACSLDTHFDYYDDYIDNLEPYRDVYERDARSTTDAGLLWLVEEYDGDRPYFLWLHYQDTHGPYHPPPDKPVEFSHAEPKSIDVKKIPDYIREPRPRKGIGRERYRRSIGLERMEKPRSFKERFIDDGLAYVDRYDEELAYADFHINRLLRAFEERGLLKNTLVIFSADHGESMMDHEQWFTHSYHIYEELSHVPLLIRYPNQKENKRVQTRVSLVDILPTILDLIGLERPVELRGKPLTEPFGMEPLYTQGMEWRSMIYNHKKWLIEYGEKQEVPEKRHVYDLLDDPMESHRLKWIESPEADAFYSLIAGDPDPRGVPAEYAKGMRIDAPKVRPGLDKKTLQRLRSLGYVQ